MCRLIKAVHLVILPVTEDADLYRLMLEKNFKNQRTMSNENVLQQPEVDRYGNPKEWKKQKLDQIRAYHMPLIGDLGISPLDFNMKMAFYDRHGRYVVGVFASEFKKDKGFFFELVTRDLDPMENDRKVYRIARNDNFEEEYEMNEKGTSYLVPVDELRLVNAQSVAISKDSAVLSNDRFFSKNTAPVEPKPQQLFTSKPQAPVAEPDVPYSEMTLRDYIAIQTRQPVSSKDWVNRLVTQNNKPPF
jgi:hypothetical protein